MSRYYPALAVVTVIGTYLLIVVGEADAARRALNGLCPVEVRQLEEFA